MTNERVDDTERKRHYGAGRQPWDDIVSVGWAPQFAAGNILKYLRRDKTREHSLESAQWYWARLKELYYTERGHATAAIVLGQLLELLSPDELLRLQKHGEEIPK